MHILRDRLCNIQAEKFSFGHGRIVNISNLMNRELENIYTSCQKNLMRNSGFNINPHLFKLGQRINYCMHGS